MPSHSRKRSPLRSLKERPVMWTRVPGAWLTISSRALASPRTIGRGPSGRCLAQIVQARTSAKSASSAACSAGIGEETTDIGRDDLGCRTVVALVEERRPLGGLEIELDRARAGGAPRFLDETGGGIDVAGGADGDEHAAAAERLVDPVHLQRHL